MVNSEIVLIADRLQSTIMPQKIYPQEMLIEQHHVDKALSQTKILFEWLNKQC